MMMAASYISNLLEDEEYIWVHGQLAKLHLPTFNESQWL